MRVAFTWGCNTCFLEQKLVLTQLSPFEPQLALHSSCVLVCACTGKFAHSFWGKSCAVQHKREMSPEALAKCTSDSISCGNRLGFAFVCVPTWRISLVVETYAKRCPESSLKQNRKFSFAVLLSIVNHVFFYHPYLKCTFLASKKSSPVSAVRDSLHLSSL